MGTFYAVAFNTLLSSVITFLVWFGVSIWVYLETGSVLATSIMSAFYALSMVLTGFIYGPIVDRSSKRSVMLWGDIISLIFLVIGFVIYQQTPVEQFRSDGSVVLWGMVLMIFLGVIISGVRNVALPALITILVKKEERDRANGLVGTITGVGFIIAPMLGGILLALAGMFWILLLAIVIRIVTVLHLLIVRIPQDTIHLETDETSDRSFSVRTTLKAIGTVPGLWGLFLFNSFNNMLGGVFMPLIDPYALSLMRQEQWGILSGVLSIGFILGGLIITRRGVGSTPVKNLFKVNLVMWGITVLFALQPSIVLFAAGVFGYFLFVPFIEAIEHTIVQNVVPVNIQGRVFGLAVSIEQIATPVVTLLIGPVAQFVFVPFMTDGAGVDLIGAWFGVGTGRGIALLFTATGFLGFVLTLLAMRLRSYKVLAAQYAQKVKE
ncbi:MAG: enterobactin exporter EntS [candidate division WS6 bacterium OLB20]|uniref:Enterobactin exporter EntS n=1 Tax=candidate division WS6 bacterium OLB20 TaxID=1617426 RepID=A0A136LWI0_9BACT|nr:MAG: enterobactin exporter EntS [candidate division WS6 bacterium OLB20]